MGKKVTKEQIQAWIDWKRGELKVEEKLRGRGTNYYQTNLKAIIEAETLISECTNKEKECHARNGNECMNGFVC